MLRLSTPPPLNIEGGGAKYKQPSLFLKMSDLKEKVDPRPDLFSSQFRTGANMIAKRIGEQI